MFDIINEYLKVFLISMLPIVELRGAIPIGVLDGQPIIPVYLVALLGNTLPVPFLILFSQQVLRWLAKFPKIGHFFQHIIDKAVEKSKSERFQKYELLALFTFVAIPLPGTGAWTGSLIAAILQINWKKALPVIFAGIAAAGVIMILLSVFVGGVAGQLFGFDVSGGYSFF
ncbi:MAG: small multi-drug export protein [Oscillospiraceae bacterium]|nr:small multi-drug export protein [Oscillospiraceae bacterium]